MTKHPYLLLSLLPILLWVILLVMVSSQNSSTAFGMTEADGLIMGTGDEQLTVFIDRMLDGEVATDIISLRSTDGRTVYEDKITIDYDLYGRGLIKGIQVDNDPELELLAWGNNVVDGESFYLDFNAGGVERKRFDTIPDEIKNYIINDQNNANELTAIAGLMVLLTPVYYLILLITFFVRRPKKQ